MSSAASPLVAAAVSAVLSAATLWLANRLWQAANSAQLRWAPTAALAAGIYAGCFTLGQWPRWPAVEDRDRLLLFLLPLALVTETLPACGLPRWPAWLLRWGLAAAAAPLLLHNTTYLADLTGPGSAEWSRAQAAAILLALALLLGGQWGLLAWWQKRHPKGALSPVLALTTLAAAATIVLSGYFRAGMLGLPLVGALAGVLVVSCCASQERDDSGLLGIGLTGLFALLVMGRFFGSLPSDTALCLWLAPQLLWISDIPGWRKVSSKVRVSLSVALIVVVLLLILSRAGMKFLKSSKSNSNRQRTTIVHPGE